MSNRTDSAQNLSDIGRGDGLAAVAAEVLAEVVGDDEEDVLGHGAWCVWGCAMCDVRCAMYAER